MINWVEAFSYPAVFLLLLGTGVGAPVSEDLILLTAGWVASTGRATLSFMLLAAYVGILCADGLLFRIGRTLGPKATQHRWVGRLLKPSRVAWAAKHFDSHGALTVFIARLLPGVRTPSFLLAGISGMSPGRFLLADALGALITVPLLVLLGFRFGGTVLEQVRSVSKGLLVIVVVVVAMALAARWLWRRRVPQTAE